MTMSLVRGMTTNNTRKQRVKKSNRQIKAEQEHAAWLKSMGVGKTTLPVDAKGRRLGICELPDLSTGPRMTSDRIAGNGVGKERKIYTGNYIIGAATMHKSNCIPITNKEQAIEVSQMRRN
jgi:hypothetical protein